MSLVSKEGTAVDSSNTVTTAPSPTTTTKDHCSTGRIPRRIVDVARVEHFFTRGFISFTGARYGGDERYALVEIRLGHHQDQEQHVPAAAATTSTNDSATTTIAEFANALMYLYSIHRRCVASNSAVNSTDVGSSGSQRGGASECGLVFVVSLAAVVSVDHSTVQAEQVDRNRSLLRYFQKVLHLYMHRIQNGVNAVLFVDVYANEIAKLLREMEYEADGDAGEGRRSDGPAESQQILTMTPSELHDRVASASEFTDTFGGTLTYDRERWVAFRQDLERFMHVCQTVAKICVANNQILKDAYSDTKMASFWTTTNELDNELSAQLKRHQAKLEENPCTVQLLANGDEQLRTLRDDYEADLKHLRSYREATEKIASFYAEVRKVMTKVRNGTSRRLSQLETYANTKRYVERCEKLIDDLSRLITTLDTIAADAQCARRARSTLERLEEYCAQTVQPTVSEAKSIVADDDSERSVLLSSLDESEFADALPGGQQQRDLIESVSGKLRGLIDCVSEVSEATSKRVRTLVECYDFVDQAYDWALDSKRMLKALSSCTATMPELSAYLTSHPPISYDRFNEQMRIAAEAGDEKLRFQCKAVQERCVNTERELENWIKFFHQAACATTAAAVELLEDEEDARSTRESVASCQLPAASKTSSSDLLITRETSSARPVQRRRPSSTMSASSCMLSSPQPPLEVVYLDFDNADSINRNEKVGFAEIITEDLTEIVVSEISENTLRKKRVERLAGVTNHNSVSGIISHYHPGRKSSLPSAPAPSIPPPPSAETLMTASSSSCSSEKVQKTRRPFRKLMKRSNTCDDIILNSKPTRHQSLESLPSISEESGDSGAFTGCSKQNVPYNMNEPAKSISNNGDNDDIDDADVDADSPFDAPPPFPAPIPPPPAANAIFSSQHRLIPSPAPDCSPNVRMQHMIANELLLTEEAYVASLHYVIEHYLSELHRTDLPHQLLGQRLTIFGNIEKIFEFHWGQFLPALKRSCLESNDALGAQVAKCFQDHRSRFHLYALYNKNKPKSDALLAECAAAFFQTKQLLLRDKLDLSSYLLKPVQRMGKYALMLQQFIKSCPSYDQEQMRALKEAEEMVTFQLRHGNDLLAMDSIQFCNMNLKEQGQLFRQDEFVVYEGRSSHKCIRRVFLFEHLVLFTKPRRVRGGGTDCREKEMFQAKRCMKMNDVGMTEQMGESNLKFELWLLRHTSGQRYVLQAQSPAIREAWINCIRHILSKQVHCYKELRRAEVSSMGGDMRVDLKPSEDRIEDRAVNPSLLMKGSQPRFLSAQLDHCSTYSMHQHQQQQYTKRPHSIISVDSSSSGQSGSNVSSSATDSSSGAHSQTRSIANSVAASSESGISCDFARSANPPRSSSIPLHEEAEAESEAETETESSEAAESAVDPPSNSAKRDDHEDSESKNPGIVGGAEL